MTVSKMLTALRYQRHQLDEAITSLERLERLRATRESETGQDPIELKKRGRPLGSKNKPKVMALAG